MIGSRERGFLERGLPMSGTDGPWSPQNPETKAPPPSEHEVELYIYLEDADLAGEHKAHHTSALPIRRRDPAVGAEAPSTGAPRSAGGWL